MKIAIIGTGGVGGYYGGLLARAGLDVTFVARGEHCRTLRESGLTVRGVDLQFDNLPVKTAASIGELEIPDLVLVSTKTYDRDEAARALGALGGTPAVIPLLNGIDNDLEMKRHLPNARVYAGLCYIISARTAPGVIEQTAGSRTMIFGERKVAENAELKDIEHLFRSVGILATASTDIEHELWRKFLWITAFAGMTALCRSSIGPIMNDDGASAVYLRCLDEGIAVARAAGVPVSEADRAALIEKSERHRTVDTHAKSSLLVDIENKRRTEIEALNGTLVRLAQSLGVSAVIHEVIYQAVKIGEAYYGSLPLSGKR